MLDSRYFCLLWSALLLAGATVSSRAQGRGNGFIDPTFTAACPSAANAITRALLVQPDGRIIVGGQLGSPACANGIVRLLAIGARDSSFSVPLSPGDFVTSIATQSTGKVIIGGQLVADGAGS